MKDISQQLNQFFNTHLPISDYLGMQVDEYTGDSLTLYAPLNPSINDKFTAFGGSLYCMTVMSCWGMAYLKALEAGIDEPNIVVAKGNIQYHLPVDTAIRATCVSPIENGFEQWLDYFNKKGRAKIDLCSSIMINDKEAVSFSGQYAILKK